MALLLRSCRTQLSRNLFSKLAKCHKRCLSSAAGMDLRFDDDIAVITMRNKDNRFNAQFIQEFNSLLDMVEENKNCRGLMTTGEGKFYSNGIDLAWASKVSTEELISYLTNLNAFLRRVLLFPLPTMAVMNGHAFAGGAMLAATHDLRSMNSEKGWICFNEVMLSVRLSEFMMSFLRVKLGDNLADALILGRRYTADEALNNNLIHTSNPTLSLEEHSKQHLKTYIGKHGLPRKGVALMKEHAFVDADEAFKSELAEGYKKFSNQFIEMSEKSGS